MQQHLRLFLLAVVFVSSTAFVPAASFPTPGTMHHGNAAPAKAPAASSSTLSDQAPPPQSPAQPYIDIMLCRHGETCHNAEGRCQGMEDVSRLTDLGEAQAAELGRAIAQLGERIDRVFISPLARARHTFDHMEKQWRAVGFKAYPRCAPTFVPEIQEICLYTWQGNLRADLQKRFPEEYDNWMSNPAAFRVGEHFPVRELWARARQGWQQILLQSKPGERVLVVAHSGINQALCFAALGGHDETMYRRLNFPNCGALHLRLALPTSVEEAQRIVQTGGYTLPVVAPDGDGAAHYRRLHPPEWVPEVHLPLQKASTTAKEPVGANKR